MKYVSYILSIISVFLLLNIFLSYSSLSYRNFLNDTKNRIIGVDKIQELEKAKQQDIELNSKILNSLEKINENLENIKDQWKENTYTTRIKENLQNLSGALSSKTLDTLKNSTTSSGISNEASQDNLNIPWTLIAKLLPEINVSSIKNNWVFGIKDNKLQELKYLTFYDEKKKIKLYIFDKKYNEVLLLFKRFTIFKINESNSFFSFSFFLNSIRKDSIIRFVTISETKAIGFEVDKSNYDLLKRSLLD